MSSLLPGSVSSAWTRNDSSGRHTAQVKDRQRAVESGGLDICDQKPHNTSPALRWVNIGWLMAPAGDTEKLWQCVHYCIACEVGKIIEYDAALLVSAIRLQELVLHCMSDRLSQYDCPTEFSLDKRSSGSNVFPSCLSIRCSRRGVAFG